MKPHVPAFVAPQLSEAMDVIQEVACGFMVNHLSHLHYAEVILLYLPFPWAKKTKMAILSLRLNPPGSSAHRLYKSLSGGQFLWTRTQVYDFFFLVIYFIL